MRPVVILVAGDPIETVRAARGGYGEIIRAAAGGEWRGSWLEVDLREEGALPELASIAAAIVTGSAASVVDREPWVRRGEEYLRGLVRDRVPTFGICFGHQMLGQALGGSVAKNPRGREIGTVDLELLGGDPLFGDAAPSAVLRVNTTHVDTVERLPPGATVLARTRLEPNAAVRFGDRAWGVQFHPEMDAAVVRSYLEARRDLIAAEGADPEHLLAHADDAPAGQATLRQFLRMVP